MLVGKLKSPKYCESLTKAETFILKAYRLKAAPDGSIFVVDDKKFLKFNKDGKFLANLQKIGEGPGEHSDVYDFQVNDNRLMINTAMSHKILICDLSGGMIKEMRLNAARGPKRVLGIFTAF